MRHHHVDHGRRRDVGSICTGGQVSGPRRETRISAIVYLNVYPRSKNRPASIGHILPKLLISLARPEGFEPQTPRFVVWCSFSPAYLEKSSKGSF